MSAAAWGPYLDVPERPLQHGPGRPPRMEHYPWQVSCGVDVGATAAADWYWRHPAAGCRHWAGPYWTYSDAHLAGLTHRIHCDKR